MAEVVTMAAVVVHQYTHIRCPVIISYSTNVTGLQYRSVDLETVT